MKRKLAQTFVNLFHPMLALPWAALLLITFTPMCMLRSSAKWTFIGEVMLYSVLLPLVLAVILYKMKMVKDVALHDRKDRIIPLLAQIIFLVVLEITLQWQALPLWALSIFKGGILLAVIACAVSFFWKISGHAMANGALATIAFVLYFEFPLMMPLCIPLVLLVTLGLVCSLRLYLKRHTLAQVAAGALAGCLSMLVFL
ncbi:MAG: hypothetical protein Q4B58_03355 [Bacteroidales bacterium]|nr:hypothetical protein [Bacteroidales bacterium]